MTTRTTAVRCCSTQQRAARPNRTRDHLEKTMTDPTVLGLLRDAERYLSALHGSVARHDNLGADFTCEGCTLRDRIAAAVPGLAAVPSAPADRADLRDRIAQALYERERPPRDPHWPDVYVSDREVFEGMADAVLAVLPPADRAAVLSEAADALAAECQVHRAPGLNHWNPLRVRGMSDAEQLLRRLAAEAQQTRTRDETHAQAVAEVRAAARHLYADIGVRVMAVLDDAAEAQQPEPEAQPDVPCSQPNPCDGDELCSTHEAAEAHAEGEHAFCGPTCEVRFPTEQMRNFVVAKGYPGTAGMLDELLRRAGAQQPARCSCAHARTMHTGPTLFCAVAECACTQYAGAQQQPDTETPSGCAHPGVHPDFTCAEANQTRPFWEGRWGEQRTQPAVPTTPAKEA
ncbi:hypothetical protein ACFVT5_40995 [Streptomyces sp. NPDC058001]|uniref:hypothetical protein n=1 Tax=Streptomyces sp. NPDC058001 TaxID=3346300 RepID=UPI0036F0EDEE